MAQQTTRLFVVGYWLGFRLELGLRLGSGLGLRLELGFGLELA